MDAASRRLAALFVLGVLALFSPLTGALNRPGELLGVPTFPLYLFGVWTALVAASWLAARGGRR